jgi:multidrug resistance efflux pump
MHPNPRRIIPVILLILVASATWWYLNRETAAADSGVLVASGTIEAIQVQVSAETGGRVMQVTVAEGDGASAGQILVQLDDSLLQAQRQQAEAAVRLAQANYDLVAAGTPPEQQDAAIAQSELELVNARQALQNLFDLAELAAAQVQQEIAAIDKARDLASQRLDNLETVADPADVDAAWSSVVIAKDKLEKAQDKYEPYEKKSEDNVTRAILQAQVAAAQKAYDSAETRYNNLVGTSNQYELAVARADLSLLESKLSDARRRYEELQLGPDPDALEQAQARLALAESNLARARAEPTREQFAQAQAQVDSAQSQLEVLAAQLKKLVIASPVGGTVLVRMVEPGEVINPGSPLLTLARLDDLRITVYLPEDRYGAVQLGQSAQVTVDSYPGTVFRGVVVRIADQAEFTPRNVQTNEGRRTMVFAVELSVDNPEGRMHPGMPADVVFDN